MGTISKHKIRLSLLPSSSQLRYATAYILITFAVLLFLNIYTSATIRRMIFNAQQQSLEGKIQVLSSALLQVEDLSSPKTEQTINSLDDLHTTRTVVTGPDSVALYDSLESGNATGKLLLFPELVQALQGWDTFYCRYADGAIESRAAVPLVQGGETLGAVYVMQYNTEQGTLIAALQTNVLRISIALEGLVVLISLVFSTAFSRLSLIHI